jgi:phosphoglycolate phosphatase
MSQHRTVIFDLDGTLVESAPDLADATAHVMANRNLPAPAEADIRKYVGGGARKMLHRAFEAAGLHEDQFDMKSALAEFLEFYGKNLAVRTRPFPGVLKALDQLQVRGERLGICTNKYEDFSAVLLRKLDLAKYFGAVLGGDSLDVRKPDGGHILGVIERLKTDPAHAIMVGDTEVDVKAARNAGIPVIAVSFGYSPVPADKLGADLVIDKFDALLPALDLIRGPA